MSPRSPENPLSDLLRQGDPLVDDPGLSPEQTVDMRREILAEVPESSPSRWLQLSPALSVAVLLAVALGIAWWPSAQQEPIALPLPTGETTLTHQTPGVATGSGESGNALETRKIQFETPGGTLVVWVLNPNFPS